MGATVLVGRGMAQDTVSTKTTDALKGAWKDPNKVVHCLNALDLYTRDDASRDPAWALNEILSVATAQQQAFLRMAHNMGKMPELLAKATTNTTERSATKAVDQLFKDVDASITNIFASNPEALDRYVNKEYGHNPARALYSLLNTLWGQQPLLGAATALQMMEKYRTCYGLDRDRLFGLVSAHFQ